ncbi:MAG: cation diffusion facilitator family transporter [Deltaproteobacteria bacterium]|jgi:cobalt-zinc-cadmium efflux system protein|nr:cation diffusion facilitator family transporter [Deltaproteobacteria bacterium]
MKMLNSTSDNPEELDNKGVKNKKKKNSHHHIHHHSETKSISTAFFLNLFFTVIEIFGGLWTNSTAIVADAVHDFGDTISLGASWYLEKKSEKNSNSFYTFGYRRFSLLGALVSSVVLSAGSVFVLMKAVPRLFDPQPVNHLGMIGFALGGILVNGLAVFKLSHNQGVNSRAVMLHLLEDFLGWAAVAVTGVVLIFYDFYFLDPLLSLLITLWIIYNLIRNLRYTISIFLQKSPAGIDTDQIKKKIIEMEEVCSVHHLHLWTLDGLSHVFTVHVQINEEMTDLATSKDLKERIRAELKSYDISHCTIEIEMPDEDCQLLDTEGVPDG